MPVPDLLHVTTEPMEDAIVVRVTGEIDMSTVDVLRRELGNARAADATTLLDLSGVTFIDSSGLRILIEAHQTRLDSDASLTLRSPSAAVQRLLEISGLTSHLDVSG